MIAEYAASASAAAPQKEYGYRNGQLLIAATVTIGWGTAPTFNDNPLQVGVTTVQARHITELRTAIDRVRSHYSLAAYSWQYSATTKITSAGRRIELPRRWPADSKDRLHKQSSKTANVSAFLHLPREFHEPGRRRSSVD